MNSSWRRSTITSDAAATALLSSSCSRIGLEARSSSPVTCSTTASPSWTSTLKLLCTGGERTDPERVWGRTPRVWAGCGDDRIPRDRNDGPADGAKPGAIRPGSRPVTERPESDRLGEEEAEKAAGEAGAIGGRVNSEPGGADGGPDEAQRPLVEAGQGEAEGFEQAEQELIEHASHGDQHAARRTIAHAPQGAEDARSQPAR